jgi:hypothetical protein
MEIVFILTMTCALLAITSIGCRAILAFYTLEDRADSQKHAGYLAVEWVVCDHCPGHRQSAGHLQLID